MSLALLGRILVAIPFLVLGVMHFANAEQLVGAVPFGGIFMVYLTGVGDIAVALGLITGWQLKWAGLLGAVLALAYAFGVHLPAVMAAGDDQATMAASMGNFLKDFGLAGGSLMAAYLADRK